MKKTTFKQACKNQGYDPDKIMPDFSMYPEKHRKALVALAELFIMADDANRDKDGKDFIPDWNDSNPKWRPWVDMEKTKSNPSGFRFLGADFGYSLTYAALGSRLSFRDSKTTQQFFENNKQRYKDILTLPESK
jgi:hypothetical protein